MGASFGVPSFSSAFFFVGLILILDFDLGLFLFSLKGWGFWACGLCDARRCTNSLDPFVCVCVCVY